MKQDNQQTDPTNPVRFHREDPVNQPITSGNEREQTAPPSSSERMPNEVEGLTLPAMVKDAQVPPHDAL